MFSFSSIIVTLSPLLSLLAVIWSLMLLVRIKDRRILLLSALGAYVTVLELVQETYLVDMKLTAQFHAILNLPVSMLLLGVVVFTGRIIRDLHETEGSREETETVSRVVIETAVNGIVLIDQFGNMRSVNRAVEKIFGFDRDELVGRNVKMLMPEPDHSRHDGYIRNYLRTGEARIIGIGRQVKGRRKDSSVFPLNLAVSEINLGGERFFAGVIQDLSELQKERDFISATLDTAGALIVVLDVNGQIVRFNRGCQRITGYSQEEVIGLPVWNFVVGDEQENVKRVFNRLADGGGTSDFVNYWRGRDGEKYLIEWSNTTLKDGAGRVEFVIATGIDITEKHASQLEIKRLSRGVIEIQEDERNRIAREIHDVLGQSLIALKLQIQNIVFDIKDAALLEQCRDVLTYINQIVQEARELSHSLSPLTLRNLGLNRAVRELAATFESGHRIKVDVDLDHIENYFEDNWNDNVYRIIQEGLINAYKHANCDRIEIIARQLERGLLVLVRDNGRGLDESRRDKSDPGLGLLIMKERARMLGADIELHSTSDFGTEVRLLLGNTELLANENFQKGSS